jgi:hypothetical protein
VRVRDDADPGKQRLTWKWNKGVVPLDVGDLGDPLAGGTAYAVCIYDQTGGEPVFKMGALVAPGDTCDAGPCWSARGSSGWVYKNRAGNAAGITKVLLKSGEAGKAKVLVRGAGAALPLPAAASATEFFDQDPAVIVQLHATSPPSCWSSAFATAKRNDDSHFKATAP